MDVAGAVVTPSARDAAAAWGITLAGSPPGHARAVAATGKRTVAAPATPPAHRAASGPAPLPAKEGASAPATAPAHTLARATTRIALGADHGGVAMKDALLAFLRARGATVHDVGTFGTDAVDYPDFAIAVARAVATGAADLGVMVDGAGIGSCMAANKIPGVRAAMCYDVTTASNAREHNNANVLTLGGTLIGARLAQEIVRTFLDTPFAGGRHANRVDKINALDAPPSGR